jgi:hypothetical protein
VASDSGIVADDDHVGRQRKHEVGRGRRCHGNVKGALAGVSLCGSLSMLCDEAGRIAITGFSVRWLLSVIYLAGSICVTDCVVSKALYITITTIWIVPLRSIPAVQIISPCFGPSSISSDLYSRKGAV